MGDSSFCVWVILWMKNNRILKLTNEEKVKVANAEKVKVVLEIIK